MIDQDYIYFDMFDDTYVLQKEPNAPPERYITIYKGALDFYAESWYVKVDGKGEDLCLDFAFDEEEYDNIYFHNSVLKTKCERNNCTLLRLRYIVMPPVAFNQILGWHSRELERKGNANENL